MKLNWTKIIPAKLKNQRGAAVVYVSLIAIPILVGTGVVAVDIGNLLAARNELKNAADAGALAGAKHLYTDIFGAQIVDGNGDSIVNTNADQIAADAATANYSQNQQAEVTVATDVARGHWDRFNRTFTPNNSTGVPDLWGEDETSLYGNTAWINAVRVTTHRSDTPVPSWFSRFFGQDGFTVDRTSVAHLGFGEGVADTPFAPCEEDITTDSGAYDCGIGRMSNSGNNNATNQTGAWTSLEECVGGNSDNNTIRGMVCGDNPLVAVPSEISVNNGDMPNVIREWLRCWDQQTPIEAIMPVIDCADGISNCSDVVGTVKIYIVWMIDSNAHKWNDTPTEMAGFESAGTTYTDFSCAAAGEADHTQGCWTAFADHFNLQTHEGVPLSSMADDDYGLRRATLYFVPSCEPWSAGTTGVSNYGVMAEIPVLVDIEDADNIG